MINTTKKVSIKAVIFGGLVDVIGTNVTNVLLMVVLINTHVIDLNMLAPNNIKEALSFAAHPLVNIVVVSVGVTFSIFSGYVSATIAKRNELLHGALSALLCIVLGLSGTIMGTGSLFAKTMKLLASLLMGIFGGYIRILYKKHLLTSSHNYESKQE